MVKLYICALFVVCTSLQSPILCVTTGSIIELAAMEDYQSDLVWLWPG